MGTELYLTNDNGEFQYQEGETVTFKIGQLTLGSAKGGATISPRDIASEAGSINVARVLQTLDDDGDPTNGITISADVRSKAASVATPRNIGETANLDEIESEITSLSSNKDAPLVTADQAEAHLEETLSSISGRDVTSCSDAGAEQLSAADFNGLTLGLIDDEETLLFQFRSDNKFTEYNSGDNNRAVTWNGDWTYDPSTQKLTLEFINEYEEQDGDEFRICSAGNRIIADAEDGTGYLYRLNMTIDGPRAAGTYLLKYPANEANAELGAVLTLGTDSHLKYFEGEAPTSATVTYGEGEASINWNDESNDKLYFLSGQPTRTAIYLDFAEDDGSFQRIGVAKATAPIVKDKPTADDLAGKSLLFRSNEDDEVVVFELNHDGTYVSFYNDSYDVNDEREGAERREDNWTITEGVLHLDEDGDTQERWRIALAQNTTYWALKDDENEQEINKIDSVSISKPLIADSFLGTYDISIPTENNAKEVLTISAGGSCDYSGTGCNWSIDENGKGVITFASGSDARGNVWQMADRSNGYIFVMTHDNNRDDVEPGYMTRR
ncbi:hypothetical protein BEE62_03670 [Marinobacter nauticus]|uniref:Uncharacterized protein n=2 Tax=Marinobacter nauticus TaxID=2743 RepID=A0A1M2UV89_MARNT|nr:hypothetical protein BEE62_03670 [Marinobacter nauticus]